MLLLILSFVVKPIVSKYLSFFIYFCNICLITLHFCFFTFVFYITIGSMISDDLKRRVLVIYKPEGHSRSL